MQSKFMTLKNLFDELRLNTRERETAMKKANEKTKELTKETKINWRGEGWDKVRENDKFIQCIPDRNWNYNFAYKFLFRKRDKKKITSILQLEEDEDRLLGATNG